MLDAKNASRDADPAVIIDGMVEHIIYRSEDSGYTVFELSTADLAESPLDEELITAVGVLPAIAPGESVRAVGSWVVHPTFGKQFKIESCEKQLPVTSDAICKYLASGIIPGIGVKTARRIVGQFGVDTFDVMEHHPDHLADIPGISYQKAMAIGEEFKKQFGLRAVMLFCQDHFGPSISSRIYQKWGANAVDLIRSNPYRLCDEIRGIGFERADSVARSLGIENYREARLQAALKYLLADNGIRNGHVYIPRDRLLDALAQMFSASLEETAAALEALIARGAVICDPASPKQAVYLASYYEAEKKIADKLFLLERTCPRTDARDADRLIRELELEEDITYANMQRKAILGALGHGVMLLTGGPGTGKTTIVRAMVRIFEDLGMKTVLAAPTGRAAKRLSEATLQPAKTIHRMLEMVYSQNEEPIFMRNESNLLEETVFIIEASSMIDTLLMSALLKAMKPGARLILIGDADQLPSVGAGNVLRDLLSADCFFSVRLKEIFRQAGESMIILNAHAINEGEYPNLTSKNNDFFFLSREKEKDIAMTVADLCLNRLPRTYGDAVKESIQVITPSRKGEAGTVALNALLQTYLNPASKEKKERKHRDVIFREGDKVMQIRNNYDLLWKKGDADGNGIFNGDIGTIRSISVSEETMEIDFDERTVVYEFALLDDLEHAYAITVHKSQGSEYPIVIMPIYPFSDRLLTRNLLYTAVTRAQRMVVLVGQMAVVGNMVQNNRQAKRYTGLKRRLQERLADEED